MLLRPAVVVIRRVVVALVLSVFVGVTAIAQTTPAWAVESWSTPVDLSENTQDALEPQIVAAPNNTLTAIWYRYNGTKFVVQTRTSSDAGATWSTVVDLSDDTQSAEVPQIVAAPNNTLTAIWWRSNGSNQIIQTRTSTDAGATWSTVVDLSENTQTAYSPQIVAAPNNTLTAIWYRNNGTKYVIQSSSLAPSSSASSSADAGVPGIFLTVAGPVGRSASEAPVYYGADRVAVTSNYLLTVTRVSNVSPTITTLAEGTIDADGSFSSMTRLPALAPGVYNVQMVGTHVNGSTLQLTSQVTIGGVGQFTSIGANIPVIK